MEVHTNQHLERWKKMIAENTRLAEGLESKKFRLFSGPGRDPDSDISANLLSRLREINTELQRLIDRRG
jgi:hypothetical protein